MLALSGDGFDGRNGKIFTRPGNRVNPVFVNFSLCDLFFRRTVLAPMRYRRGGIRRIGERVAPRESKPYTYSCKTYKVCILL